MIRLNTGDVLKIEPRVVYEGKDPFFTWTKDNGALPANTQLIGFTLYVGSVGKENEGVYTLTLEDSYGKAKIQVTVYVEDSGVGRPTTRDPKLPKRFIGKVAMKNSI